MPIPHHQDPQEEEQIEAVDEWETSCVNYNTSVLVLSYYVGVNSKMFHLVEWEKEHRIVLGEKNPFMTSLVIWNPSVFKVLDKVGSICVPVQTPLKLWMG